MECMICSKKLVRWQKKFCSSSCAAKHNNRCRQRKPHATCKLCGDICKGYKQKFCSRACSSKQRYIDFVNKWLSGYNPKTKNHSIPLTIRRYLFEQCNDSCLKCGWSEINPYTGKVPLTVHHKDGDADNNRRENLELLCPNCHSLTETYGARNKGNGRKQRQLKRKSDKCG